MKTIKEIREEQERFKIYSTNPDIKLIFSRKFNIETTSGFWRRLIEIFKFIFLGRAKFDI